MWCDDFDADLLKVVPGAAEALGPAGDIRLTTYSTLTDGKINAPACWNTDHGLASFFWTAPETRPAGCWTTTKPEAACTLLEAVRDEWGHSCAVIVNGIVAWRPPARTLERLLFDLRGWTVLSDEKREEIRESVRRSLRAAGKRVLVVVGS